MSPHPSLIVALKTVTLLLGGLITYFSYNAYQRTKARPLWYLAVGFGVVTLGTLLAGIVDQIITLSLISGDQLPFTVQTLGAHSVADIALVLESGLTAVGFAIIVYSLYTE